MTLTPPKPRASTGIGWRPLMPAVTALVSGLLAGCQSAAPTAYEFPTTWPGSAPLSEAAPTISVYPIDMAAQPQPAEGEPLASGAQGEEGEGLPTAAVLSVLLIKHLHVNGVNAVLEKTDSATAKYALSCAVPRLGYAQRDGFPQQRIYQAELSCVLKDQEQQQIVWERRFTQEYAETTVLDMMTKLPPQPHRHDRVLFRECIVPLWDSMASIVGTVVTSREQARALQAPAEPSPLPAESTEQL